LRTLRELLDEHEIGLSDLAFALRLRADEELRQATDAWLDTEARRPADVPAREWLRFEQDEAPAPAGRTDPHTGDLYDRRHDRRLQGRRHRPGRFGRKEIQLAEHEMPGLMATRASSPTRSRSRARASPARCT
jgi:hypothetical protein